MYSPIPLSHKMRPMKMNEKKFFLLGLRMKKNSVFIPSPFKTNAFCTDTTRSSKNTFLSSSFKNQTSFCFFQSQLVQGDGRFFEKSIMNERISQTCNNRYIRRFCDGCSHRPIYNRLYGIMENEVKLLLPVYLHQLPQQGHIIPWISSSTVYTYRDDLDTYRIQNCQISVHRNQHGNIITFFAPCLPITMP